MRKKCEEMGKIPIILKNKQRKILKYLINITVFIQNKNN